MKKNIFLFLFLVLANSFYAQKVSNYSASPTNTQINAGLAGYNLTVTGGTLNTGSRTQIATFSGGLAANLEMDKGVYFSTGLAETDLSTKNTQLFASNRITKPNTNTTTNDSDLTAFSPNAIYDVVTYTFNITLGPDATGINIIYQFGSDEYPDYVGSAYNDAVGYFVSGPNITGKLNLAKLPNNNNTTINTINSGIQGYNGTGDATNGFDGTQGANYINNGHTTTVASNGRYIQNNVTAPSSVFVEHNGISKLISYSAYNLLPGQTYTFKIVLADAGDYDLNTGVFIQNISGVANIITNNDIFYAAAGATTNTVIANDTFNGTATNISKVNLSSNNLPTGFTLNSDGTISIAGTVAAGSYTFNYTECEKTNPNNCKTGQVTVVIKKDSDGDLIIDDNDLDNDNDGILDSDEGASTLSGNLTYEFYRGSFNPSVDNIPTTAPLKAGTINNFDVTNLDTSVSGGNGDKFGVRYSGNINITTAGSYTFYTSSDDGSKLFIDGSLVVNNDGDHGVAEQSGTITLPVGLHSIKILFYENGGDQSLSVSYSSSAIAKTTIPFSSFSTKTYRDTDGDGIPDYLDLDSDNDGCVDAIEGDEKVLPSQLVTAATGLSVGTGSSASNKNLGTTVDANGVPTIVNSGGSSDIGGDQGQGIGSSTNSSVNTCLDSDADGIPNEYDFDSDNDGILDVDECNIFEGKNPGFEIPDITQAPYLTTQYKLIDQSASGGWKTTATDGFIEYWRSGFNGVPAAEGNQFVEINGTQVSTLYQDFVLNGSGGILKWSVKHRGRQGVDVAEIKVGTSVSNLSTVAVMSDGNTAWGTYTGSTYIPAGQTTLTVAFASISASGGSQSIGNFVDDVKFFYSGYCDKDGDGIPNYIDLDSDGDGCPDAGEGGQIIATSSLVPAAGTLASQTPNVNITTTAVDANGVPTLVSGGQGIGSSQNNLIDACFCYNNPNNTGTALPTTQGITLLKRAGVDNGNWPMIRTGAFTVLESNTKGFVITRMTTSQINGLTAQEGMMVYDTTAKCLKLYDGSTWSCFSKPACP